MKTIKHKENRDVKKICNSCKHFEKRKNMGVGPFGRTETRPFCYLNKVPSNKDSTCNKWEAK